jgi:tight adherence protein B
MTPILFVLVFLAALLALEGVFQLVRTRRGVDPDRVRRRLRRLAGRVQASEVERGRKEESLLRAGAEPRLSVSAAALALLPNRRSLELLLYRAGMPLTPARFLIVSVALGALGWLLASGMLGDFRLGVVGVFPGAIPWLAVRSAARRRMRRFSDQFAPALELLVRALRAGHGIGAGFQLVGQELGDPIGTEFAQVAEEIRFGLDVRSALENLAHRMDDPDLPYFVTAVMIQRETGGNLAELLDKLSTLLRERAKFHGKVRALTAQARLGATILALWLPLVVVLMLLFRSDYIMPLVESPFGLAVFGVAGLLGLSGYLIARRLADVEA